jgi:aminoglycoside phosphotransferase (APT) family kinase protein
MRSSGVINRHDLLVLDDGRHFVARTYGWPFGEPETVDRQAKEEWLLPRLRDAGVPVPEGVGSVPGAILTSYIDGLLLAETPRDLSAWADAGRTLAIAHQIEFDAVGLVVAGGVDPFAEGGWGLWQEAHCKRHASRLVAKRPELLIDLDELEAILATARPVLDVAPIRLVHTDCHPWNVLVRDGRCVAWLDWEFAWAADPTWDFVRNEFVRISDIGPTPKAFYDGYGQRPDPLRFGVCELSMYLWMAKLDAEHCRDAEDQTAAGPRLWPPSNVRAGHRPLRDLAVQP